MSRVLPYIMGILVLLAVVGLIVAFKLTRRKELGATAVALIEAQHAPTIHALEEKIRVLEADQSHDVADMLALTTELAKKQDSLRKVYGATGMSAEEIAERFNKLGRPS